MIPVLYNHSEKSFTSNGLGRLTDCTSCIVTEERNGVFECEFKYPIFGRHYDEIAEGCIIFVTHDNSGIPQPFDIYKRSVPISGEVTFNAAHVSYRLGKCVLMPYQADSCASALEGIKTHCVPECEFNFITDKNVSGNFNLTTPTAAKAILCGTEGSILDVFGTGEYKFNRFLVGLYLHRGIDTDVQIRYGKNLVDLTDDIDSSDTYTAVIPFWSNPETGAVKMLPEGTVVAEDAPLYLEYWTDENGRRVTDENNNEFQFAYPSITAVTLDLSTAFDVEPTFDQMRTKAQESVDAHKGYTQSLSVDFVQLAQSEEYKDLAPLQELNLCDTCKVIYDNRPVRLKVIRTEYDVLKDRYSQIDLGDPPANYADVLTGELSEKMEIVPTKSEMRSAIKTATDTIKGVNGGNVVFRYREGKPAEILIMDTDDVETAVHVLRINMNGIGFSSTGIDGEYTTAWTLDGTFVANFIKAGTLSASRINGGTLSAIDGDSYWNLNKSIFSNIGEYTRLAINGGKMRFYSVTTELAASLIPVLNNGNVAGMSFAAPPGKRVGLDTSNEDGSHMYTVLTVQNEWPNTQYNEPIIMHQSSRQIGRTYFGTQADQDLSSYVGVLHSTVNNVDKYSLTLYGQSGIGFTYRDWEGIGSGTIRMSTPLSKGYQFVVDCYAYFYFKTHFDDTVEAYGFNNLSDENLKNIAPYNKEYDKLLDDLEPVTYTWKENDSGEHVGLGARQTRCLLEKHGLADSGFVVNNDDVYSINFADLTVMLLKRVQDQTKQIKDLTERIKRLEAVINADS